ncbi:MAG: alpha-amylase family glycosyl hydrolase [Candidatus Aenigmatarchaeota archaeon]|nr:hypothetical protein [Candidatus Aenigmarchaeota archaeon]
MNKNWFKDAIIYHIFIDRFAGFDERKDDSQPTWIGGNLNGVIKKIHYFKKLGINCIWLSPFYKSSDYHGYSIEDFYNIDEHFGNKEDLKKLVKKAHKNEIRVIADFVPNHCSEKHPFFIDAKTNKNSKYRDWFYFKKWPDEYLSFLGFKNLPKINLENKEARKYIIDAAVYWLKDFDLDGFRIDHVIGLPLDFLKDFSLSIKKIKPEAILIGEVWFFGVNENHKETIKFKNIDYIYKKSKERKESMEDIAMKEFIGILDGCLDFEFNKLIRDFIVKRDTSSKDFFNNLNRHYSLYPTNFYLPTFLDNHDMNRFLFEAKNNVKKIELASVLQFCLNQPVIIYYGDEIGLSQAISIEELENNGDVQARRTMIWNKDEQNKNLYNHYRKLCLLRDRIKLFKNGKITLVYADSKFGLLSFIKEDDKNKLLIILNPDQVEVTFTLNLKHFNIICKYLIDLFLNQRVDLKDSIIEAKIKPNSFMIYLIK